MLTCTDCHIEYEGDNKFCGRCGRPLVAKEEPALNQQKATKNEEMKQGGKPFCPICKITYEFGNSCINCGSSLGGQPDFQMKETPKPIPTPDKVENLSFTETKEEPVEPPKEKLICPYCKIFYEKMKTCIRCGADLVSQLPSPEKEETEAPQKEEKQEIKQEVKQEASQIPLPQKQSMEAPDDKLVCPNCRILYRGEIICKKCSSPLVRQTSTQGKKEVKLSPPTEANDGKPEVPSLPRDKEISSQPPLSEQQLVKKQVDGIEKKTGAPKTQKSYKRLFLEIGSISIMVIAGGYFLWLIYSYISSKDEKVHGFPKEELSNSAFTPISTSSQHSTMTAEQQANSGPNEATASPSGSSPAASTPTPLNSENSDKEGIRSVLENIRKANLQKNLELFMSCYSSDFKDREEKKKTQFEVWRNFSYHDLFYDLNGLTISGKTAKAKVEWLVKFSPKTGGQPKESKTVLDVTFKKEEEEWKIKEIKPVR